MRPQRADKGFLRAGTEIREAVKNKSERPVDALAVKKYQSLTESLSDNLKSRDASASKNNNLI